MKFPLKTEAQRGRIKEGRTIYHSGKWWLAALVVEDEKYQTRKIEVYKWGLKKNGDNAQLDDWYQKDHLVINQVKHLNGLQDALQELAPYLGNVDE